MHQTGRVLRVTGGRRRGSRAWTRGFAADGAAVMAFADVHIWSLWVAPIATRPMVAPVGRVPLAGAQGLC
jgi:hypothetical protein